MRGRQNFQLHRRGAQRGVGSAAGGGRVEVRRRGRRRDALRHLRDLARGRAVAHREEAHRTVRRGGLRGVPVRRRVHERLGRFDGARGFGGRGLRRDAPDSCPGGRSHGVVPALRRGRLRDGRGHRRAPRPEHGLLRGRPGRHPVAPGGPRHIPGPSHQRRRGVDHGGAHGRLQALRSARPDRPLGDFGKDRAECRDERPRRQPRARRLQDLWTSSVAGR